MLAVRGVLYYTIHNYTGVTFLVHTTMLAILESKSSMSASGDHSVLGKGTCFSSMDVFPQVDYVQQKAVDGSSL